MAFREAALSPWLNTAHVQKEMRSTNDNGEHGKSRPANPWSGPRGKAAGPRTSILGRQSNRWLVLVMKLSTAPNSPISPTTSVNGRRSLAEPPYHVTRRLNSTIGPRRADDTAHALCYNFRLVFDDFGLPVAAKGPGAGHRDSL